jgi:hypothetical protein
MCSDMERWRLVQEMSIISPQILAQLNRETRSTLTGLAFVLLAGVFKLQPELTQGRQAALATAASESRMLLSSAESSPLSEHHSRVQPTSFSPYQF